MAAPIQESNPETIDTRNDHEGTFHHLSEVNESLRRKNEQTTTLELPERLLASSKDNFETYNRSNDSEESSKDDGTDIPMKEEDEGEDEEPAAVNGETMGDSPRRERELSSSLPDNHESVAKPASERDRVPNYRPSLILRSHKRGVAAVKYSPDGRRIASCCMSSPLDLEQVRTS